MLSVLVCSALTVCYFLQKPANILVMGEGPDRGRVKIGMDRVYILWDEACVKSAITGHMY